MGKIQVQVVILLVTIIAFAYSIELPPDVLKKCVKGIEKFPELKSHHSMIKTMLEDDCQDKYLKMSDECFPIIEEHISKPRTQTENEAACNSEAWQELFIKHKPAWDCLIALAKQFGHSEED